MISKRYSLWSREGTCTIRFGIWWLSHFSLVAPKWAGSFTDCLPWNLSACQKNSHDFCSGCTESTWRWRKAVAKVCKYKLWASKHRLYWVLPRHWIIRLGSATNLLLKLEHFFDVFMMLIFCSLSQSWYARHDCHLCKGRRFMSLIFNM